MRKTVFVSLLAIISFLFSNAQNVSATDSSLLLKLNQQIDDHVVSRNLAALDTLYANDFVFSHGSGRVEGKTGWLTTVGRANYPLRKHDSVKVELHPAVTVVKGKMSIQKINKEKTDNYHLRYIRVFAWRSGRWQMISHNTTHEWHE